MKKHIRLTLSLLLLLTMASFTLIPEITLAVLGVYIAVFFNLLIFRLMKPQRGFRVTRRIERRHVTVGESVGVDLGVSYTGSFPIMGELKFKCESLGLDFDTGPLVFKPSETNTYHYSFPARRRGLHTISPVELNVRDWLLLSDRKVTVTDQEEILVLPHIYPLRSDVIGAIGSRVLGLVSSGERGRSSEIWGLRDYHPGDDFKLIAWKAMAKMPDQSPKTKVTVGEVGPAITVVLDVGEDMGNPNGDYLNLDVAADLAASICYSLIKGGVKTGLIFYDNKPLKVVRPDRSARHLESIIYSLALAEPTTAKFRIANLAAEYIPADFGSTFILIVGRIGDTLISTFVNYLSKLRLHRQLILIIVYTEALTSIAEKLQRATVKAGVPTLLASSKNVRETLQTLERYAYADLR